MEPEFYTMLPRNFTIHTARLKLKSISLKDLAEMEKKVEEEAVKLADADVDIIGYGCTSGSLFRGLGHDKMLEERIARATGKPAITTAGAVIAALNTLKIKNVSVATPYTNEINNLVEKFLVANGFRVVDLKGLHLSDNLKIGRISAKTTHQLISRLKHEEADGIFICCTNFPTIKIIQKLEDKLKKPVISSNTATLWAMLRKLNKKTKIKGYGKLLKEH
jgi:maleate isomerase